MNTVDYIALAAIVFIVGAEVFYIVRAKKRGEKCVGCPYARGCGGNCNGGCGHTEAKKKTTINNNVKGCVPSVASLFKKAEVSLG